LTVVPYGMMKWGNGRWRLLFAMRQQAEEMANKATYEWKGMTLVMRLVKEIMVKSVVKVKFFSVSEKEVGNMVEKQGAKIVDIRELRPGGLRSGRWLVLADKRIESGACGGVWKWQREKRKRERRVQNWVVGKGRKRR
jgi:hypothetical protein